MFVEKGSTTGVDYKMAFEQYLELLSSNLRKRKNSTLNIFRTWDSIVFPTTGSSLAGGSAPVPQDDFKRAQQQMDEDGVEGANTNEANDTSEA